MSRSRREVTGGMSTWWPVLAVFWGLYVADGLRGARRIRFYLSRPWGGPVRARVAEQFWFLTPLLPGAWTVVTEDLPASLAPDGVCNSPSGSAGRPPPWPEHARCVRWEEMDTVDSAGGWIRINGTRFAPETPGLPAADLRRLRKVLQPLPPDERKRILEEWIRRRFRPLRLRRRVQAAVRRTRGLVVLNSLQTLVALAGSAYLVFDLSEWLPPAVRAGINAQVLPLAGAWFLLHALTLVWFFRIHRRFHPDAGQERWGLCVTALLVPPQALRLRQQVMGGLAAGQHPLSAAAALAGTAEFRRMARTTVTDLRWPRLPARTVPGTAEVTTMAASLIEPCVRQLLAVARPPVRIDDLLRPPAKDTPTACAYCPRCGDQFTRADAACPHGIPLQRF